MEIYHFLKYTKSIFKFYIYYFKENLWKNKKKEPCMENSLWGFSNPYKIHLFPWFHLSLILSISSIQIMLKKFTLKNYSQILFCHRIHVFLHCCSLTSLWPHPQKWVWFYFFRMVIEKYFYPLISLGTEKLQSTK